MKLEGKVALVTGAGRRVGRALAVALGAERMRVAVHYNASADGARETQSEIQSAGGEATLFQADPARSQPALPVRCAQIYSERFADADGRIRATFDIVWLSGWAPHESQQKPLKPGSAKVSLEAAVKRAPKG